MEDYNPEIKFFCTRLKQNVSYQECLDNLTINKLPLCVWNCITGAEVQDEYLKHTASSQEDNSAHSKRKARRPSKKKQVMKKCCMCKKYKLLAELHKNKNAPDGLQWYCKECSIDYKKEKKEREFRKEVPENEKNIEETKENSKRVKEVLVQKQCAKCKEIKPTNKFNKNKSRPDGLQRHCRQCAKKYYKNHTWERYGKKAIVISFKDREELLKKLVESAELHFRTTENEIMWLIKEGIEKAQDRVKV